MTEKIGVDVLRGEFIAAFHRVWETAIGLPLSPSLAEPPPSVAGSWIASVVWLGGQWTGCVTIAAPSSLARHLTARMLDLRDQDVSEDQYIDAMKELANMSAGNLKSVLPGPCGLATPGHYFSTGPTKQETEFPILLALQYLCEGAPIKIALCGLNEEVGTQLGA